MAHRPSPATARVVTPIPIDGTDGELIQLVPHEALPNPRHVVLSAWEAGGGAG